MSKYKTANVYKYHFLIILIILITGCRTENLSYIPDQANYIERKNMNDLEKKHWSAKDIEEDSIPGVSLDRAYREILHDKIGNEVIVAVIDMQIDINHEDLHTNIWTNTDEIPGNNIDDDDNGYIDDVNGWNFLGTKDKNRFVNLEVLRILRRDSIEFPQVYKAAKNSFLKRLAKEKKDSVYINNVAGFKRDAALSLSKYFKEKQYTVNDLDSLKSLYPNDKKLHVNILKMSNFITYGFTEDYFNNYRTTVYNNLNKSLNPNYNDRLIIGDTKPDDLTFKTYGNNIVNNDIEFLDHGTLVSGVIGGIRSNEIGVKGFSDNIKIMPLCVAVFGDEHDKDIALAIRYAVDNGAKVINMSFGKDYSLHKQWVFDALKYASSKNVLVVTSSGNSGLNLNDTNNYYPNDNENNGSEVSDNLIMVGATSFTADENLFSTYSNYGDIDVDIFAPGEDIYTTAPSRNDHTYSSGTSMSTAIVSGVAALIYSYYPRLTVSEVKQVILDSGTTYTFSVKKIKI